MRKFIGAIALITTVVFAGSAFAGTFTEADNLYQDRGVSQAKVQAARTAYTNLLSRVSGDDLIYAVSRICALDIVEGDHYITERNRRGRTETYAHCWESVVEKISPAAIGKATPQYYYWKAYSLAVWGKVAPTLSVIGKVGELKDSIAKGKELDTRYQGGGILRIAAGVHCNKKAQVFGLYDPDAALVEVQEALDSDSFPGDPNGGLEYYTNYKNLGYTLIELDRLDEAKTVLEDAIAEIDEFGAPEGLEPETAWERSWMVEALEGLQ